MTTEGKQYQISVVFFLTTLFFVYPNRAFLFAPDWIIFCFGTASITLIACGLIFWKQKIWITRPKGLLPAVLIFLVCCSLSIKSVNFSDYIRCISYVVLPAYGFLYRKELKKVLPVMLTVLWCLTLAQSLAERFIFDKPDLGGLPLNKNWNITLLLGCLPFVIDLFRKWKCRLILLLIPALYVMWYTASLAMVPVLAGILVVALWIFNRKKLAAACILSGIAGICILWHTSAFQNFLEREDRPFFYRQTVALIADSPVYGHGPANFEQAFLPYRTKEYFALPHAADRVNHPHNHLLYITAGTGLTGLAAWLYIWLVPVVCTAKRLRKKFYRPDALLLTSWLVFAIHGQVDMVMEQMPMNIIALLLTGMLWKNMPLTSRKLPVCSRIKFGWIAGLLLTFAGVYLAWEELDRSIHFRKAERLLMKNDPMNRYHYEKATKKQTLFRLQQTENQAYYDYRTALRYCTADPQEQKYALSLLERFDRSAVPDFAHANLIRGRLLLTLNNQDGIKYLLREAELYPLHPEPLLAMWFHFIQQRNQNAAAAVAEELNRRFAELKLDAEIKPENMFPASWQTAEISGTDGQNLLRDSSYDVFKYIRKRVSQ